VLVGQAMRLSLSRAKRRIFERLQELLARPSALGATFKEHLLLLEYQASCSFHVLDQLHFRIYQCSLLERDVTYNKKVGKVSPLSYEIL